MACNLTFSSVEFELYHTTKPRMHSVYLMKDLIYADLENVVAEAEIHYIYGDGRARGMLRATGLQFTSLAVMESLRKMNKWRRSALSILEKLAVQAFLNAPVVTCVL
nr:unnamed protein product [Spirometra erinaceieuropaei]